ncbi:aldo/keto reductase [Devosia psychrophila]|uniref:D-threo-aldose 1-dehydrogenase n=1 Tax=Devosia psychrophila TaxID=728005 RepID=A0A0F5Q0I0_9HYPH|nr:aldo/keto reductase [Devosia psychrophila]KKC33554.1 pyridoxal 4-dehydrogenase [Devosia psychrophila]SFC58671.1 D-threo-aldose 1-dehydrogenase [Devosia psychrophila]
MAARTFEKRRIGRTDLEVTTLGLGGASLAGIFTGVPPEQARATVAHALDAGINYVDTAPQYGLGRSEHMVGDALRERRAGVVLSSKVGRLLKPVDAEKQDKGAWVDPLPFNQVYDYSYDGVMRSFEDSQQRLGLKDIDILYVHDIGAATHGVEGNKPLWAQLASGGYKALRELRDAGVVKAIGLGVNEWQILMDAFELGDWDVFLLAGRYTLLEQTSLTPFMTTCIERGTSVVVGGPFNSGILVGGDKFNYEKAPDEIVAKVRAIETVCREFGVPLPAAALQFPLTHPAVCNVLPGPRSPQELDGILDWWDVKIPGELWTALADRELLAPGTPIPGGTA